MKIAHVLIIVLLSVIAGLLIGKNFMRPVAAPLVEVAASAQPIFERMKEDRVMRCSYMIYAPYLMKDPNTGQLSGAFYELTEKLAQFLEMKVEWRAETTPATFVEDMRTGRYDIFCGGLWAYHDSAEFMAYTKPAFYVGYNLFVRADDHRFDGNPSLLNDPQYKFVTIDGEMSAIYRKEELPLSGAVELPATADISMLLLEVSNGHGDATVTEPAVADLFLKSNPGAVRMVQPEKPVRLFSNVWAVPADEQKLINLLNLGIEALQSSGEVNRIAAKYFPGKNGFYPVAPAYVVDSEAKSP